MSEFRADLHTHSTFSDGSDTPEQLILLAQKIGLKGLSITDHDTLAAYQESAILEKQQSLLLLPGVEFSAMSREEPVHILAYAFSLQGKSLLALCQHHKKRREERNIKMIERLRGLGIDMALNDIQTTSKGTWGRPHIADVLLKKGYVQSIQQAFELYLAEGKPAYVQGEVISVEETLKAIYESHGKAILAHPHLIKRSTTIRTLLKMPFSGIECYYARLPAAQEKKWLDLARQREWLITGGSDYHGTTKPFSALGSSWISEETFLYLYEHFLKVN